MKTLLNIVGVIVICMLLLLVTLRFTGLNPYGDTPGRMSFPGLWLSGNLVTAPVTDWSFTDNIRTVKVQTDTRYGIPHSVTTWCIAYNGQLYLATSGAAVREWPRNVARDPHVRLKIGNDLYDRTLMVSSPTRPKRKPCAGPSEKIFSKISARGSNFYRISRYSQLGVYLIFDLGVAARRGFPISWSMLDFITCALIQPARMPSRASNGDFRAYGNCRQNSPPDPCCRLLCTARLEDRGTAAACGSRRRC